MEREEREEEGASRDNNVPGSEVEEQPRGLVLPGSNVLTTSRMKDARACQRLHHLKYHLGYRSAVEPESLRFGSLWHRGLEAWWRNYALPPVERLTVALAALEAPDPNGIPPDPFDLVRAEILLRGYEMRWGDELYDVLGVEVPFLTVLRNPLTGKISRTFELAGKIDAIVRERLAGGRVLIVEHKTTSEDAGPGTDYWRRLRMDGQVSNYYEGGASLGFGEIAGCLYDVVRKPAQRPLKATPVEARKYVKATGALYANQRAEDETPDEYRARLIEAIAANPDGFYFRGEVVRLEDEMKEALYDTWTIARQMREAELAGRFPRNPDSCFRYGRMCPFFPVCSGEASLDDANLFKKIDVAHPELEMKDSNGG